MTTGTGPAEVRRDDSMQRQKDMLAAYFHELARAPEQGRKVVYTFVPGNLTELIRSFGLLPVLPEINALQSGMRKKSGAFIQEAEKLGHSGDVCTYVKCDIGMMKQGNIGPTGEKLPPPDLLLLSYTGCFTFMKWFELLKQEYDCPVVMLHVPYQADGVITPAMVDYIVQQMRDVVIPALEKVSGVRYDEAALAERLALSAQAEDDLVRVFHSAKRVPSPIDAWFGAVYYIGPLFSAFRGTEDSVEYYRLLREEVEARAARGEGPVTPDGPLGKERYRLVAEGPPNWTSFREFWRMFAEEGAVCVASTYTKVGGLYDLGFRHDPQSPLESLAKYCLGCYTNLSMPARIDLLCHYVKEYRADGFFINSVKSCNSFSAGQLVILREVEERTGVPGGFVETDLVDPRYFSAANVKNRIESYLQMIEQRRAGARAGALSALDCCVGIDLGSTTTKAILLDEAGNILGRGITNSRSNYDVACQVARTEALVDARVALARRALEETAGASAAAVLAVLARSFDEAKHRAALDRLRVALDREAESPASARYQPALSRTMTAILDEMERQVAAVFAPGAPKRSDFFRDIASSSYLELAQARADRKTLPFEALVTPFDKAILVVENEVGGVSFEAHAAGVLDRALQEAGLPPGEREAAGRALRGALGRELCEASSVGTGYGRARLPFPKENIRSEILCHGLGAHAMFPASATVLDIGGQDTKAIQLDATGIVTSFQMNDRCAAGCGRYLGYIADEMSMGVHELGPLAMQSTRTVRINSTCTVFAGAELRDRLNLGQAREDILAGLHRAIMLRAMSLLARSGGVHDEFTFTGGVARNPAAVLALRRLIDENYGERTINISAESIYTGALGAAIFARRAWQGAGHEATPALPARSA